MRHKIYPYFLIFKRAGNSIEIKVWEKILTPPSLPKSAQQKASTQFHDLNFKPTLSKALPNQTLHRQPDITFILIFVFQKDLETPEQLKFERKYLRNPAFRCLHSKKRQHGHEDVVIVKRSAFPGSFHYHWWRGGLNRIHKVVTSAIYKNNTCQRGRGVAQ